METVQSYGEEQAIENIKQMQQTVIADLTSDIDEMAMRMTTIQRKEIRHCISTNRFVRKTG